MCYGITLYNAIANFSYLFQGIGVYAVTMEMLNSLLFVIQIDGPEVKCRPLWCFPCILGYIIGFIIIFCKEISKGVLHYFYSYNAVSHMILAGAFFIVSKLLYGEMSRKYPSFVSQENKSTWIGVAYTIMILMIVRAVLAWSNYMGFTFYLKSNHLGLFTLYIIVFVTLFDLLPCVTLTLFMQIHMEKNVASKSMGRIAIKADGVKHFANTNQNNIMEEMVDFENAEEDWV